MARLDPVRIAKWLGVGFAAAWLAMLVVRSGPDMLGLGLFFLAFHVGPAGLAAMLVKASRGRSEAWFFLVFEALLVVSYVAAMIWADYQADRDQWSSVGASMFVAYSVPFYQYCAVGLVFLCAYAGGWRARPEWLKP